VRIGGALTGVLLIVLAANCSGADEAAPLGRVDYLPYQVSISLTFSPDPEITPAFQRSTCSLLRMRLEQTFGATWTFAPNAAVRLNDRLVPPDRSGLDRLSYAAARDQLSGIPCDKAYILSVGRVGSKWLIAGREWDRTLETLGATASQAALDRAGVVDTALAVIKRLFSPLLVVNDADRESKSATLAIRAGSIPLGDPKFEPLKAGDILRPVFRFLDSKRAVRSVQAVPWTYLVLQPISNGRAQVKATVISSYRAPLAANMRRRVEALAVRARPDFSESRLKLVAGKNPVQPQAGLFVSVGDWPAQNAQAPPMRLLSDRHGEVTIPVDPSHPIVRLDVHSGAAILARRPFVPGLEAEVTLEVADDRVRLGAEREIDILESQLIETVARRGTLVARTLAAIRRTDTSDAQELLDQVDRLPPADEYLGQLNRIRVLALEEAHNRKDRIAERRIEDLCRKTLERITQYLSDDRVATFKQEVAELMKSKKAKVEMENAPMHRPESPSATGASPLRRLGPNETKPVPKRRREAKPPSSDASGI
jgi:hypothetical protein